MEPKVKTQKANIQKFTTYSEAVMSMPEPNLNKGYLEAKRKIISEMWEKIDSANDEIVEGASAADLLLDYFRGKEFDKAFTLYDKVLIKIQTKLEKFEKPAALGPVTLPNNMVLNTEKVKLKLKPMDIPAFSGDYKKWLSFRSLFDSMVRSNDKIEDIEKMHYLKQCLAGDAEGLIAQFDVTAAEYAEAYKVITDRYHNDVILVDAHIMDLLSLPNLTSESSDAIKKLMDGTASNLRALKTLKIDTTTWDPILLLLLVQKLDKSTRRLWEKTLKPKVRPTINEFLEFLGTRFHALGCQQNFSFSIEAESKSNKYWKPKKSFGNDHSFERGNVFPPRIHQSFHNTSQDKQKRCRFGCGGNHEVTDCESFRNVNLNVRYDLVNGAKLCKNCLRNHPGKCSSKPSCKKCGRYHHTLLHAETKTESGNQNTTANTKTATQPMQTNNVNRALNSHHAHVKLAQNHVQATQNAEITKYIAWDEPVILATAMVLIRSARDNIFYPFRALLDQASEASYVSESVMQFLGLPKTNVVASTSGLGGVSTGSIRYVVDFELGSKRNPSFTMKVQAPVVKKITNPLPSTIILQKDWDHIKDLELADPEFHTPGNIDILLGAPIYGYLLLPGLIKVSQAVPVAQNTEFGWILSGGMRPTTTKRSFATFHLKLELEDQLRKFFEQEEVSKERILTQEEIACEKFFEETVQRNADGRYVVALPFKEDPKLLGSSKGQAFSRFMKLETRLQANKEMKEEYTQILEEYVYESHDGYW